MTDSTVYGPVNSWRLGRSLGIDVLCVDSICSFACVYCQLGHINRLTSQREVFVTTERIMTDLAASDWKGADFITFSGSGEPTLAKNLGEVIRRIKSFTGKPVVVLTNSTLLGREEVRAELMEADRVFCKLDAWDADTLRKVDRPAEGITLEGIVEGIRRFRAEFKGEIAIQTMILKPMSDDDVNEYAKMIASIGPDEIQLNIPSRPVPAKFVVENRGNEVEPGPDARVIKSVTKEDLLSVRDRLQRLVSCDVVCR